MRGKQAIVLASAGLGWRVRADLVIDRGRGWRLETGDPAPASHRGPVAPGHCSVLSSPAANGHSIAIFRASGHVTSFHTPDPGPAHTAQCYTSLYFIVSTSLYTIQSSAAVPGEISSDAL